jgi:hypothetical protein
MLKGKLGVIPEIAAYGIGALITIFTIRMLWETDAAAKVATIPVVGTLLVTAPKAAVDRALA